MGFDTAANILNKAAKQLGLLSATVTDPYASQDQAMVQLCALLEDVGKELVRARRWTHLVKEKTFSTSAAASYALPADFLELVPGTHWNRTSRCPAGAPVSSQEWQFLKAQNTTLTLTVLLRPWLNALYVYPSTDTGSTLAYEYLSSYWVVPTGQSAPTTDAPSAYTDTLWLDEWLLTRALKLAFRSAKGLDTFGVETAAQRALDSTLEKDTAADTLRLGPTRPGERLLDGGNVPDTGLGS
jgi:hypothetical protein